MGKSIRIQGVFHLCSDGPLKNGVRSMTEIESMEQRKKTKLKSGEMAELVMSFVVCENCNQKFSISYIEVK